MSRFEITRRIGGCYAILDHATKRADGAVFSIAQVYERSWAEAICSALNKEFPMTSLPDPKVVLPPTDACWKQAQETFILEPTATPLDDEVFINVYTKGTQFAGSFYRTLEAAALALATPRADLIYRLTIRLRGAHAPVEMGKLAKDSYRTFFEKEPVS